jgi:hypothetical protein
MEEAPEGPSDVSRLRARTAAARFAVGQQVDRVLELYVSLFEPEPTGKTRRQTA